MESPGPVVLMLVGQNVRWPVESRMWHIQKEIGYKFGAVNDYVPLKIAHPTCEPYPPTLDSP